MKKSIAVHVASSVGAAHGQLSLEALRETARRAGYDVRAEIAGVSSQALSTQTIAEAALVVFVSNAPVDDARFWGKPQIAFRPAEAIRHPELILEKLDLPIASAALAQAVPAVASVKTAPPAAAGKKIVAITSCPTGIAHTFMAAEALKKAAAALGHTIRVETQGSVGAKSQLTPEEIAAADVAIIAADTNVEVSRFNTKTICMVSTQEAIHDGKQVVRMALTQAANAPAGGAALGGAVKSGQPIKVERPQTRKGAYKHLMTGVSHMLPVVIAGGLAIALAFALGGIYAGNAKGTLGAALSMIGGGAAFQLMVAVLSGYIAYSIADRPGLAPGLIGGLLAQQLGAGFLGGIVAGFLAGYLTKFLAEKIKLPDNLDGLKPVLILPFISTIVVGLLMIYVVAPPVQIILEAMTNWLNTMRGTNAVLLGALLGAMMGFDMGGPVNKAAYTFSVGLLASKVYTPMAATMAAGMVPPLGIALAVFLAKKYFDEDERKAGAAAAVLGLAFITEGAIPFAAKDPLRVIPALALGAATTGALSMLAGAQLLVPHGGIFALLIPGAVTHLVAYLGAIIAGTLVTTGVMLVLKRRATAHV